MGKRGPPKREGVPRRPHLIVPEQVAVQIDALGTEQLARMIVWALPIWKQRREGEALKPEFDAATVILRPQPAQGVEPASLWYDEERGVLCCLRPVKNLQFWELMKANGLEWHTQRGRFERCLTKLTGNPIDRVAELAHLAYEKGWPVALGSSQMADLVIQGRWRPEHRRWVQALKSGDLLLTWELGGDSVYQATKRLPSARWDKALGGTVVDLLYARDVQDFAQQWSFALTERALQAIESAERQAPHERLGVKLKPANQPHRQPRQTPELPENQGEVTIPEALRFDH